MTTAIIYSGYLRSWDRVKANHEQNIWGGADLYFYTHEDSGRGNYIPMQPNLLTYPAALDLNRAGETSVVNTLNQWRNRKKAFEAVPDTYDVYVIARTDIEFSGKIEYNVKPNHIYIPSLNDHRDGINDQFAYGDYDAMKIYCSLIDHYRIYFNAGILFHPETYLKHHLKEQGIEIIRISQTNNIVR